MSLLCAGENLIQDLWPADIPQIRHTNNHNLHALDVVPTDFEQLLEWAYVARNPASQDPSRRHVLLHKDSEDGDSTVRVQVSLRVQGFVKKLNLKRSGNWNTTEQDAPKACQYISLTGGPYEDIFKEQISALDAIKRFVLRSMSSEYKPRVDKHNLFLHRRVFTKVHHPSQSQTQFHPSEDPTGALERIAAKWKLDDQIFIGRLVENNTVVQCHEMMIQPGDFVDATVVADIASVRNPKGRRIEVHFKLEGLVQLLPRPEVAPQAVNQETQLETPIVTRTTAWSTSVPYEDQQLEDEGFNGWEDYVEEMGDNH